MNSDRSFTPMSARPLPISNAKIVGSPSFVAIGFIAILSLFKCRAGESLPAQRGTAMNRVGVPRGAKIYRGLGRQSP
jgi:hypothetical protein